MEYIQVEKLTPSEINPRNITPEKFEKLKASLEQHKKFFEDRPCLINRRKWEADKLVIYAGNMRYRAAVQLGWKEVPCIIRELSPEEEKRLTVLDNVRHGKWDEDVLANNFDMAELDALGFDELGFLGGSPTAPAGTGGAGEGESLAGFEVSSTVTFELREDAVYCIDGSGADELIDFEKLGKFIKWLNKAKKDIKGRQGE